MKISPEQVSGVLNNYRKQLQAGEKVKGKDDFKAGLKHADGTEISGEAKLYQSAYQTLKSLPDVREEKLAQLQKAIDTGTYQVSGKEIVEKMIARSLVDKLV